MIDDDYIERPDFEVPEDLPKHVIEFLSSFSHEMRTPLNGILGFSELLTDKEITNDSQKEYKKIINECGNKLLNVINKLFNRQDLLFRVFEFDESKYQAALTLLSHFAEIVKNKYPENDVRVKIEQQSNKLVLIIINDEGIIDKIEKSFDQYNKIISGQLEPKEYLSELECLKLKHKLEIAHSQIAFQQRLMLKTEEHFNDYKEISEQLKSLFLSPSVIENKKNAMPELHSQAGICNNVQVVLHNENTNNIKQEVSVKAFDLESLMSFLKLQNLENSDLKELESALKMEPELGKGGKFGKKVNQWLGKMLQKAADGAWDVAIASAGSLLVQALSKYYGI